MLTSLSFNSEDSYLGTYRLPPVNLAKAPNLSPSMSTIWASIQSKEADPRARSIRLILSQKTRMADDEAAALKVALATAMLSAGKFGNAWKLAEQAIELFPQQSSAYRIMVQILMIRQEFKEAYDLLENLKVSAQAPHWDTPLKKRERHVCAASCAWRLKEWEDVARHLKKAFPRGVKTMQKPLQQDWFRLALYRNEPDDAAEAAGLLVTPSALDFTDALLQTLVQQGWTHHALPLYRTIFDKDPRNQLVRRRLVALCIKEGELDEARRLTAPGALDLNP
jgi:tetratricopeptide (TPR) repeat protein